MTMPGDVEIKLGLYTLACRKFLDSLPALTAATQTDTRLGVDTCLRKFNGALHEIFESSPRDLPSAAQRFNVFLQAQAGNLGDTNAAVAKIFRDLALRISEAANTWQYQDDLQQLHLQGREIACLFFKDTPYLETQERLTHKCQIHTEYQDCSRKKRTDLEPESFGFCVPPTAY
jgi:hypothetical protein